jgi:hypothetical protein
VRLAIEKIYTEFSGEAFFKGSNFKDTEDRKKKLVFLY